MRIFLLGFLIAMSGFTQTVTPTQRYFGDLTFYDDLDFKNIDIAIERQLKSYTASQLKGTIRFGTDVYPKTVLRDSLLLFKSVADSYKACLELSSKEACLDTLNKDISSKFKFYRPTPAKGEDGFKTKESLFTGYYSPDLDGSRIQTTSHPRPIYAMPTTETLRRSTREQIDFAGALQNKGLELFYVSDSLYDIWLLHVEGGGRVHVQNDDGTVSMYYLSYAGSNGQKFTMLYNYMIKHGMLTPGNASIPEQRRYLDEHPEVHREVFASSPSYIYFKVTKDEPLGVNNIPLTEGRSMATDYRIFKDYGLLQFIQTKKPSLDGDVIIHRDFKRFFISQDTGGAIKGNARADLYFGYGRDAETSASFLKNLGTQTILIKK